MRSDPDPNWLHSGAIGVFLLLGHLTQGLQLAAATIGIPGATIAQANADGTHIHKLRLRSCAIANTRSMMGVMRHALYVRAREIMRRYGSDNATSNSAQSDP